MIEAYDLHMPNCFKAPKCVRSMSSVSLGHMTKTEDARTDPKQQQIYSPAVTIGRGRVYSEDDSDGLLHPGEGLA